MKNYSLVKFRLLFFLILSTVTSASNAQNTTDDNPRETLNDIFVQKIGAGSNVFSGPEYIAQNYRKNGSEFFASDSLATGWVVYDGLLYKNQKLQWDVLQNYVIIQAQNGYSRIILRNDLIDSFYFAGHTIVKKQADKALNLRYSDFYDALYRAGVEVWARRKVTSNFGSSDNRVVYNMFKQDKFYVKKGNLFYQVTNKREVLNVFAGSQAEITRAVNKADLNWRKDFEECLIIAAAVYDQTN